MKFFFILILFSIISCNVSETKQNIRSKVNLSVEVVKREFKKIFFKDKYNREEGEKSIQLPIIPILNTDPTSVKSYNGKKHIARNHLLKKDKEDNDYLFLRELLVVTNNQKIDEVDKQEFDKWFNIVTQGGTREGVYRALVQSAKSLRRERQSDPAEEKSVDFAALVLNKYLNQVVDKNKLARLSNYSLKRIIVDKVLELLDYYLQSETTTAFYSWYAVFSSDLAQTYPKSFQKGPRTNLLKSIHRRWARGVPVEFVKSEVIIKIHKVFNYCEFY